MLEVMVLAEEAVKLSSDATAFRGARLPFLRSDELAVGAEAGEARLRICLEEARVDKRGLAVVQRDSRIRIDHGSNLVQIPPGQRVFAAARTSSSD